MGTEREIIFSLDLTDNFPSGVYNLQVRGMDVSGGDSGWIDSHRNLKVWNCQVPLNGYMYDSSAEASGAVCVVGTDGVGFSVLATPPTIIFNSVSIRQIGVGLTAAIVTTSGGNSYSGMTIWGQRYQIVPDVGGVTTRWVVPGSTTALACGAQEEQPDEHPCCTRTTEG